jgi:hypothetical protein
MTQTIDIYNSTKPVAADLAGEPWGPAFLREMDLVVAANVFRNRLDRDFFAGYDPVGLRVAERCLPLDGGADPRFMGVVALSMYMQRDDPAWQEAARTLAAMPRGRWQIWSDGQGFDLFCATGQGRISTPSGSKFQLRRSRAPGLDLLHAYAAVLSRMVYEAHCRIGDEILARTVRDVDLKVGQTWKDKRIDGREWRNVKFTGIDDERFGGVRSWRFEVSRQGSRKTYFLKADSLRHLLDLPWIMPETYAVEDGVDRTTTLYERRSVAAQAAFDAMSPLFGFDSRHGSRAGFVQEGDRLERDVLEVDAVRGSFVVEFAAGTDVVEDASFVPGTAIARIAMAA